MRYQDNGASQGRWPFQLHLVASLLDRRGGVGPFTDANADPDNSEALHQPRPPSELSVVVSNYVNNMRHDDPGVLEPGAHPVRRS